MEPGNGQGEPTADRSPMVSRIGQLLLGELLGFACFVSAGIALLGGAAAYTGESRHPAILSWGLVIAFLIAACAFGKAAFTHLRRAFVRKAA